MKKATQIRGTKAGREIIEALTDLRDTLASGVPLASKYKVRRVEVIEPGNYSPAAIVATRRKLGVSQAIFARLVGVSTILAQSWEQGKRFPHATARRVLDEINRDPKRWAGMIRDTATRAA